MSRGKAYRRWKSLSKYINRLKKRLSWIRVEYGEVEMSHDNIKYKRKLWRSPKSWKEADKNSKYLKDTPTPYKDPWKKYDDKKTIKSIREDSKKIIDEELGDLL